MLKATAATQRLHYITQLLLHKVNCFLQHLSTCNSICHPVEEVSAAKHPVTSLPFEASCEAAVCSHQFISHPTTKDS